MADLVSRPRQSCCNSSWVGMRQNLGTIPSNWAQPRRLEKISKFPKYLPGLSRGAGGWQSVCPDYRQGNLPWARLSAYYIHFERWHSSWNKLHHRKLSGCHPGSYTDRSGLLPKTCARGHTAPTGDSHFVPCTSLWETWQGTGSCLQSFKNGPVEEAVEGSQRIVQSNEDWGGNRDWLLSLRQAVEEPLELNFDGEASGIWCKDRDLENVEMRKYPDGPGQLVV